MSGTTLVRTYAVIGCLLIASAGGCASRVLGDRQYSCECSCESGFVNFSAVACADDDAEARVACQNGCNQDYARMVVIGSPGASCNAEPSPGPIATACSIMSPLRSSGPLLASESPYAIAGTLDPALSFATVTSSDGVGIVPFTSGTLRIYAPNGEHAVGPMTLSYLSFTAADFTVGNHLVSGLSALNNGYLEGSITADDVYTIPEGSLNARATVSGNFISDEFASVQPQVGWIDYTANLMYFVGTYTQEGITLDLFMVYRFAPGARPPTPVITTTPGSRGRVILDGNTSTDDGPGIIQFTWFRHAEFRNPIVMGSESSLELNPGTAGRNSITLRVVSGDGQISWASTCLHHRGCVN